MNKTFDYKKKICKKAISLTLASAIIFNAFPITAVYDKTVLPSAIPLDTYAATDPDVLAELIATYDGQNTHSFTSGGSGLSDYSKCFEDATFAANHANDTITLAPTGGAFVFDENYNPIGSAASPFSGTIKFTTTNAQFNIQTYAPIFNYVSDSASLIRLSDSVNIPIVINRIGDAGNDISPLYARHIKGSGLTNPKALSITLDAASAHSYSGVIFEMYDGAKIDLTFTDNSSHTAIKDNNGNITSGSIINSNESGKSYGILCGKITGSSNLKASYTNTNDDKVTFIGVSDSHCGGLVGELDSSTFELLSGSSNVKVDFQTAKTDVGFICGHAEGGTITLPANYSFSGTIDGTGNAGGIAGYCKDTAVNYETSAGTITISNCEIKNGSTAEDSTTGGVFGYYECGTYANDILINRKYSLTGCKVEGESLSGGIAGEYKPTYTNAVTIDLDKYSIDSTTNLNTGSTAGGLFGKYRANGNVTITDSVTTNTHFTPPASGVPYGGVIGVYVNTNYNNTLTLTGFTVNGLNCSSGNNVGGIIKTLTGSTYVDVSNVSVTNVNAANATYFGGIIADLENTNPGSFIDLTGDFTLSLASGTYKGGAIAGSFKNGVIRLSGTTDISGAQAADGYAQLVYENDNTLVYAKGSGSDENWTLIRNTATTASDLGIWGEIVRMFDVNGTPKNAEDAGIVSVSNNKVTIAQGVTAITDTVSFAKCALNMQLNDGSDHGPLCFADTTINNKSTLLGSALTVNGTIDLSGTGLLGFMRDGGKDYSNAEWFTGSISKASGASAAEIKLASGEAYGTYLNGGTGTGGKIYSAANYGHNAQGLFAFAKGASATNLTVSGDIKVERKAGASTMYAGALFGAMTNGATVSDVTITTTLDVTKADNAYFFIGGVAGLFDGKDSTANYKLDIKESCSIKPTINLFGKIECNDSTSTNAGGILGSLKGDTATKYSVSVANSEVSPTITIDNTVQNADNSYVGGMIGRVTANSTNERQITIDTVTMNGASIQTKSKNAGGLLGTSWERARVTVDGLTITGSTVNHKYSASGSKQSGLVFKGTGKWDINSLSIISTTFSSDSAAPASFGMVVNEAFSGNDGLYINLQDRGYILNTVPVPTSTSGSYYIDEIAADTSSGDILAGGNGTGIVNINMNSSASGTLTKIVDEDTPANGTGTYQNQLYAQLVKLVANQNSRYYYNLDVMMSSNHTKTDGEKFLLWSVNKYAAENIKTYFTGTITGITDIDLSGLSYYPINGGAVTLPAGATVTFGFNGINDYESTSSTADNWARKPCDTGDPNTVNARNQHYMMQTGLFTTVSSLSASGLTLTGSFGYIANTASGALINGSTSGSVSLSGLKLDSLIPSSADSYLLVNYINGTGTATPTLTVSNLRATNYASGVTLPVAKSLFGKAEGQNMTITFSDIKLDARNGTTPTDTQWTNSSTAASDMDTAYGTSRSIFSTAIFFDVLLAAKTSNMEYNYAVEADWSSNSPNHPRNVTYGKEVTDSREYPNGEKHYNTVGDTTGHFTNPISDSNNEFDFSSGFLPYVANYTAKGTNATYPVVEIKVNYKAPGITVGCGTYNDPYVITTASQFETIAKAINGTAYPGTIRLPNTFYDNHVSVSWHDANGTGDGLYNLSGSNYTKDASNSTNGISSWNQTKVRFYLASAYYKIEGSFTLSDEFEGLGKPNDSSNNYKGNTVFHGVIVGDSTSKPTITNPTNNPLIVVANGAVIKNVRINVTSNITREQTEYGDSALYGYNGTNTDAKYYGGVIGEIMGGDNIIDDVTVTYTGTTTLSGGSDPPKDYKHLIAEGGMVGAVVNGALIFRGSNSVSGRTVTGGGIYSNPYVGRVINGYAVYEAITGRTGSAPSNGSNYPIDTIDRSNTNLLDVNYSASTISVPDAQSLYILSLITQSIASTADTSDNNNYGAYSPSYGYNGYLTGVARLGDYTYVGCGTSAAKPDDYSSYAYRDSVNNYYSSGQDLVNAPTPYIIYRYTKVYGTNTITSKNYPARKMTSDNTKFWDITLSSNGNFSSFDSFQAFRGIGSVGLNSSFKQNNNNYNNNTVKTAFKVASFDGGGKTIKLHISLPRYERDQENYYHKQNISLTQTYSGQQLDVANYGHDNYLECLMGLGLFDCVLVNNKNDYQFQNFNLQGTIADKVYDTNNVDITGTTHQTQLFCVGGVVGKRVYGNNYDLSFSCIEFDGLTITGAYSCGGLIGIDAIKSAKNLEIVGCNSTQNGISVKGGYYGKEEGRRHGIGSFIGMTFWCRPNIDGATDNSDTSPIYVSEVSSFYNDTQDRCVVGGLIGYTGSGAEIRNIDLFGLGTNPVVGASNVSNAGGFIGFSQAMDKVYTNVDYVIIDNCTLNNLSVKARNSAAGFLARCGNTSADWYPKYINISNCAVIGNSQNKPEIRTYGGKADRYGAGGFIADLSINNCVPEDFSDKTSIIENCYIKNYTIEGDHTGGIVGQVSNNGKDMTHKPLYLKNIYVQDCDIITYNNDIGGMIGFSYSKLAGYNLKIDGVNFYKRSNNTLTDYTDNAGIIVGKNNSSVVDKFIGIGAYHTDASKVPTAVVKTNGTNNGNFFVFADYLNTSAADTASTSHASTFNVVAAATNDQLPTVEQPVAPFLTVNPRMAMGTDEYLTGDGASIGNAGEIYKDAKAGTSNRRYTIGGTTDPSFNSTDSAVLANYINNDGTYNDGAFKISTASAEFGALPNSVDFTMLVINDDAAKTNDITPFIKSYIRLVTNAAAGTPNQYTYNQYAYSCGNNAIDALYKVVVSPCYYNESTGKFVLGTAGAQGLQLDGSTGKYKIVSNNADSASENKYQFSLIDVQFKDPTDATKIAYHLYVPVYTKKILAAEFSAVSMNATPYYRSVYATKIASEITANKNSSNPSILVESTNEWTTTFIRFAYPKNEIKPSFNWNFDKSINILLDGAFDALPSGTKLILLDPNANADKFYTLTLDGSWQQNTNITLNLSAFEDEDGYSFEPQDLADILADTSASNASGTELYEDYYISMYVPRVDGNTHGILFSSAAEMLSSDGNDKANIESKLWSYVVLGDLFDHKITSFSLDPIPKEITVANNKLTTRVTATIELKDTNAGPYLAGSDILQAFYISLTAHDADHNVSDSIYGIEQNNISNTITISYSVTNNNNQTTNYTNTITTSYRGSNYIELSTGSIKQAILSGSKVTISAVTEMTFVDINGFPFNPEKVANVGTQVSIKSNIAYREDDLRYSTMKVMKEDSEFYYVTTQNKANLSFNAVPSDDTADEIGLKTNNRSLLGVNGKYSTLPPIIGKSVYDANDIINYESSTAITYTISLQKKVTDSHGTRYVPVSDISDYLDDVALVDSEVNLTADRTTDPAVYSFTGPIDHTDPKDKDKMFEADFSCKVKTSKNDYANYKIYMTAELTGSSNTLKNSYIIYTYAKFDPSVIDAAS